MIRVLTVVLVVAALAAACSGRPSPDTTTPPAVAQPTGGESTNSSSPTGAPASPTTAAPSTAVPSTLPFVPNPPEAGTTVCDRFTAITEVGTNGQSALTEASGIVASRAHPGVFWLHNDSGSDATVYAIDSTGAPLGTWGLSGTIALDWEDMAIGPGPEPGVDYLYVGDIGDNLAFRPNVTVHRFAEPDPRQSGSVEDVVALRVAYPLPPTDAESMFVDPVDGDLVIITKTDTGRSIVLHAPAASLSDPIIGMQEIAALDLGDGAFVTAADISPDGTMVALRGYEEVWMWPRNERPLDAVFDAAPCNAPSPVETQGEAITFTADGAAYVTVSEGSAAAVWRVDG